MKIIQYYQNPLFMRKVKLLKLKINKFIKDNSKYIFNTLVNFIHKEITLLFSRLKK